MVNPIPEHVKKLWDHWNIRGAVMASLLLQTTLILVAPYRKRSSRKVVIFTIWSAYLLADATATFAVGLISSNQSDSSSTNSSTSPENSDLLAFWTPFLLVHLGGPDTITALALEDNELWLRHLLALIFQAIATGYVFLQSLPKNKLWIPTALMFVAGCIKYLERTFSLYFASMDKFRDSMLEEPDAGPNYAKLMEEYSSKKLAKLPTQIIMMPEPDRKKPPGIPVKKRLDDLEVVQEAYNFYLTFRGMIVDLIFSFKERDKSRDFFNSITATSALKLIEVELNFMYEVLFTKVVVVHSTFGFFARSLALVCLLSSFALFRFHVHKHGYFNGFDVAVTYALFFGAVALDFIAFTMAIFSDWTVVTMKNAEKAIDQTLYRSLAINLSRMAQPLFKWVWSWWQPKWVYRELVAKKKKNEPKKDQKELNDPLPKWHAEEVEEEEEELDQQLSWSCCWLPKWPRKVKKVPEPKKFQVDPTSVTFRRWAGCISGYNLISYCLRERPLGLHNTKQSWWISLVYSIRGPKWDWVLNKIGLLDLVDEFTCLSREPLTKDLWKLIFSEIRKKSQFVDDPETAKRIASARGDWTLQEADVSDEQRHELMPYVKAPYDESLLLWHVATELLYNDDKDKIGKKKLEEDTPEIYAWKELSKMMSDYMLYLLIMQPALMATVAGIGKIRFQDTCAEAKRFFERKGLKSKLVKNVQVKACEAILDVDTEVKPINVKGDRSKSVLFDASMLAKELNKLEEKKWEIISHVWVELLSYAASHCRGTAHAQLLSKGGELATFLWLLLAHFGIGDEFQITEGHARAKLLVGK